jgi:cardiolipin synthase
MASAWLVNLVLSHLLSVVGFAMGAVLIAHVLVERRAAQSTLAWLLAIVLIPYVGVPLYLVFGGRKLARKASQKLRLYEPPAVGDTAQSRESGIARMLGASGAPPPRAGNRVEILGSGQEAYRALLALIDGARRSIQVSTLILADDEVGRAVLARLTAKAREGVEVRLLIDALFRFRASRRGLRVLRKAGGRFEWFMPVWHLPFRGHANLRLHRKLVLADDRAAILGGMNLAREYLGPTPYPGRWRDVSARVVGPAVADIAAVFRADWRFASGESLAAAPPPAPEGPATIQVVGSGPDVPSDLLYDAFLSSVFEARRRLWIATPYFVPDEALARALVLAARRGVDVRVLVPARSNHLTADLAGASYLRQLAEAGGRIACFTPGMMHAKIILVDDALGILGSANLDMRSLFLDYEIALFFSTREEIAGLESWFASLLPQCGELGQAGRARVLVEAVARLLGPLA